MICFTWKLTDKNEESEKMKKTIFVIAIVSKKYTGQTKPISQKPMWKYLFNSINYKVGSSSYAF